MYITSSLKKNHLYQYQDNIQCEICKEDFESVDMLSLHTMSKKHKILNTLDKGIPMVHKVTNDMVVDIPDWNNLQYQAKENLVSQPIEQFYKCKFCVKGGKFLGTFFLFIAFQID